VRIAVPIALLPSVSALIEIDGRAREKEFNFGQLFW
jgi:hypothetical protein